jgi:hypothetical protein
MKWKCLIYMGVLPLVMVGCLIGFTNALAGNTDEFLIQAAIDNDTQKVKQLVTLGASVDFSIEGRSPLFYACKNKNHTLAKWLIEHGATIDTFTIFISDDDNHLASYSNAQREFVSYLVYTKLTKSGLALPQLDAKAQVDFVKHLRGSIILSLKKNGPWPKNVAGWSLRLADVVYRKTDGGNFHVYCDIATWNGEAMFEFVSTTGITQREPTQTQNDNRPHTHAWAYENGIVSTKYDKNYVLNGHFIISRKSETNFVARHVRH